MSSSPPTPSPTTGGPASQTSTGPSATCTTAVPGQYGNVPIDACNSLYNFYPNFGANVAFAALFCVVTIAHLTQGIVYRKRFTWVVIMAALWETLAFALRAAGARDQQNLSYIIADTLLLLLAPLWVNAFAYMTVARLVHFALPEQRVWGIKARWLTRFFVGLDIVSFLVQAAGGSLMTNNDPDGADQVRLGQKIYMVGIGVQLAFIVVFGAMTVHFLLVLGLRGRADRDLRRIKTLTGVLLAALVLIMVRIIFRLCEFGPGVDSNNPILKSETYTFVLDGLPMLLALLLLNVVHPGTVLRGSDSEFPKLSRREKKALKQEKKERKTAEKEDKRQRKLEAKYGRPTSDGYELTGSEGEGDHGAWQRV